MPAARLQTGWWCQAPAPGSSRLVLSKCHPACSPARTPSSRKPPWLLHPWTLSHAALLQRLTQAHRPRCPPWQGPGCLSLLCVSHPATLRLSPSICKVGGALTTQLEGRTGFQHTPGGQVSDPSPPQTCGEEGAPVPAHLRAPVSPCTPQPVHLESRVGRAGPRTCCSQPHPPQAWCAAGRAVARVPRLGAGRQNHTGSQP